MNRFSTRNLTKSVLILYILLFYFSIEISALYCVIKKDQTWQNGDPSPHPHTARAKGSAHGTRVRDASGCMVKIVHALHMVRWPLSDPSRSRSYLPAGPCADKNWRRSTSTRRALAQQFFFKKKHNKRRQRQVAFMHAHDAWRSHSPACCAQCLCPAWATASSSSTNYLIRPCFPT